MYNPQIFLSMIRNENETESLGDPLHTCSPGGCGTFITPNY